MIFNNTDFIYKRDKPLNHEYLSLLEAELINDDVKFFFREYQEINFSNGLTLFDFETAVEKQKLYEIEIYDKELFIIGFSGGGEGVFVKRESKNKEIYLLDLSTVGSDEAKSIANSFTSWVENGAVIEEEENDSDLLYDEANLYITSIPKEKNKFIITLKKKLDLNLSISDVSNNMNKLPYLIKSNFYPIKFIDDLEEINNNFGCILLKTKDGIEILPR
ncbi:MULTISPECIES: hypothetical protein [Cellulophaga]|uniref:SMI1/KNR4 family protein n=1 Tax=Cellulophaga geojensis KL-A TaxID=1328323 RepID=A0ABP3B3X0_9FLAO|nr:MULTISPECIES: hypothetical protein [Cellulophaga]EWH11440.1 hypothetical protein KLA_15625 [Cellulophaga geojensis KL-A]SNQ45102.1 hypothetical protein CL8139_810001 [Cellulophaga lytica]